MNYNDLNDILGKEVKRTILISSMISALVLVFILLNRWFGVEGKDWKIVGISLAIFSVVIPWFGQKIKNKSIAISTQITTYITTIIDSIIIVALFSSSKFIEIKFEWSYILLPTLSLIIFITITQNKKA